MLTQPAQSRTSACLQPTGQQGIGLNSVLGASCYVSGRVEASDLGFALQFVPFITGPRNCLGQNFALLEARIVLALVVKVRGLSLQSLTSHDLCAKRNCSAPCRKTGSVVVINSFLLVCAKALKASMWKLTWLSCAAAIYLSDC